MDILAKWFENAPYGISFKIKMTEIENKYISINLNENGREQQYKVEMTNEELDKLANMLVLPTHVNKPVHNRLLEDFDDNVFSNMNKSPMILEIDNINPYKENNTYNPSKFLTHISSPNSFEDLIIPFEKTKRYRKRRPKTYRLIKVTKNNLSRGKGTSRGTTRGKSGKNRKIGKGKRGKHTSRR
jgi:hypothetical protein